jgi:hypothetical protein
MKAPLHGDGHAGMPMLLRALRFYPQILSLYVGFDNGDLFMLSHIAGEDRAPMRIVLEAPEKAAFANEAITAGSDGVRTERWIFLDDDGVEVGRRDVATTSFDPRQHPWYEPARHSDLVERSDLYIFASNNEPGFSLSRPSQRRCPASSGPTSQRATCHISSINSALPRRASASSSLARARSWRFRTKPEWRRSCRAAVR